MDGMLDGMRENGNGTREVTGSMAWRPLMLPQAMMARSAAM